MLGFRTRNQYIRCDAELAPVKLLPPGDVLGRLVLQPFVQIAAIVQPFKLGKLMLRMSPEIHALAAQSMRQQDFGGEPGDWDGRVVFQKLRALDESGPDSHAPLRPRRRPLRSGA